MKITVNAAPRSGPTRVTSTPLAQTERLVHLQPLDTERHRKRASPAARVSGRRLVDVRGAPGSRPSGSRRHPPPEAVCYSETAHPCRAQGARPLRKRQGSRKEARRSDAVRRKELWTWTPDRPPSFGACLAPAPRPSNTGAANSGSLKGISSSGASKFAFCSLFRRDSGRIPVIRATKDGGRAAVLLMA